MKVGARRLVYFVNFLAASGTLAALANCGGGEHPKVNDDPGFDATPPPQSEAGTTDSLTLVGVDVTKGILFGNNNDGFTRCGTTAGAQTVTLKNNTADVVSYTATLSTGSDHYKLDNATGSIPARGTADIPITPAAVPQESEVTDDLYGGTLKISFPGGQPIIVKLHQTAQGAIITTNLSGTSVDLGKVQVNTTGTQQITYNNAGNAPATINFALGTPQFTIDGDASGTAKIDAGGLATKKVSFKPTSVQDYTDQLTVSYPSSTVHCKAPPGNISLKGSGASGLTVSPATLDFGQTDCGATGNFLPVTISSTTDATFTATLAGGTTKYTLADGNGNPVTPGATIPFTATAGYTLRVVPKPIPVPADVSSNAFGDKLTITTNAPGDTSPHSIDIKQTAHGAILSLSPSSVTINGTVNQVFNNQITLKNDGNASASYTVAVTNQDGQSPPPNGMFISSLSSGTAPVGSTPGTLTTVLPSQPGTQLAALQLTAPGAVLCQNLPGKYPLQATTTASTLITVNPGALNFGLVDCGTTAAFKTVDITSIVDTTITPSLGGGNASPFTLADSNGNPITPPISLTANVKYTLRIVPKQVPIPSSTASNALGDTLTITNTAGDPAKTVTLNETAHGAIFSFNPTSITGANGTYNYTLKNDGNASGQYTLTTTGGTNTLSTGTAPVGTTPGVLTKAGIGSITLTSTSVLCADVPPPLTFSPDK